MIMFSKDALDYHTKILTTQFDGSIANSYAKINATRYVMSWMDNLHIFADMLANTSVYKVCNLEISRLYDLIIQAEKTDNQEWRKLSHV